MTDTQYPLPHLGYPLAESQVTALLALRPGRDAKAQKDRAQALVLCAAVGDLHPGALAPLRETLGEKHPRAWDELHS